jgi:hypothetical protein
MGSVFTTRVALLVFVSSFVLGAPSRAWADQAEAVRFTYDAPQACPDAESFVKEVHARTTRFQIVRFGDGLRSFEVVIAQSGNNFRGSVRVLDGGGAASLRTVDGTECEDVARTLAFVTALSIDPKALSSPSPADTSTPAVADSSTPAPVASVASVGPPPPQEPPASPPPTAKVATDPAPPPADENPAPPPSAQSSRGWRMDVVGGAEVQAVAAPSAVIGGAALLGLTLGGERALSPLLRLGVAWASSGSIDANPGEATLAWTVGRAEICPLRWPAQGALELRPCLTGDFGVVSASATGVSNPQSHVRPWETLGALALVEWAPLDPLFVEAELSLSTPLERDRFFVAPSPVVYQAPVFVPAGTLALGVRFP